MASLLAKMSSSFINTRRKLLKNRNWTFPVVRYFTRKLELVSDILWFIAAYIKRGRLQHTLLVVVFPHNNIHVKILSRLISEKNFFEKNQKNKTKLIYIYIYIQNVDQQWNMLESLLQLYTLNYYNNYICRHGTIIKAGIACKKISCYMHDWACRWLIVENGKIFGSYVKQF